jgi:hypothetical protein
VNVIKSPSAWRWLLQQRLRKQSGVIALFLVSL